jgi:hypothetical protein
VRVAALAVALIVPIALVGGCAVTGAISGNTTDCPGAQRQLSSTRASLALAQIALTSAEAFGSPSAIQLAQTAVNTISADLTSIQALVTQACAAPGPVVAHLAALPVITLDEAKKLAREADNLAKEAKAAADAEAAKAARPRASSEDAVPVAVRLRDVAQLATP